MRRFDAITAWLAGLSFWRFVGLLFAMLFVLAIPFAVIEELFALDMKGPDLDMNAVYIILSGVLVPVCETFVFQFLVVWILRRWITRNVTVQVAISALVFGIMHYYSPLYVIYGIVMGGVLAWGYCAYYERYGFRRAFWTVTLVHALRNLLPFLLMPFEKL